jgi:hypothetical protein
MASFMKLEVRKCEANETIVIVTVTPATKNRSNGAVLKFPGG